MNTSNANFNKNNSSAQEEQASFRQKRKGKYRKVIRWMWGSFLTMVLLVVILFAYLSTQLPSFEELENPRSREATLVLSADGELLGKYYTENRTPIPYDSLSPHLINALIATEDERYYSHSGIDMWALGRVLVKTILLQQESAGGGSTISQQLAKLLVGRPSVENTNKITRTWKLATTKFKEWLTAVKLERAYTKEEIISMYFNEFDFIHGAHGIKSAANIYFDTYPSDLTVPQAAMLVRMLKNPSLYNPKRDMKEAMAGRMQVLYNMKEKGHISEAEYEKWKNEPIDLSGFKREDHNDGIATYFREHLRGELKDLLKDFKKPDGSSYDIYRDGLRVYTTIDARLQRHAEAAAREHLKEHQEKLFKHWEKKDPWTHKTYHVTKSELYARHVSLQRLIWKSERFAAAEEKHYQKIKELELRNLDIDRLLYVEKLSKKDKKKGEEQIDRWLERNYIGSKQASQYRRILGSSDWAIVKKEYEAAMASMKKPVNMAVFAYTPEGMKDTTMTPYDSIRYHRMFLQTGMMVMDPYSAQVKAWVGGIDHHFFKYDHVNRNARRQVGSTMKPFLYGLTVDYRRYSPCYKVLDTKTTIEKGYGEFNLIRDWTPQNAGGGYSGQSITLTEALRKSLNSVSTYLMKDLGSTEPLRNLLATVGIDTSYVPQSPSICLGTPDLSVFEMTGAYSIFVNGGRYAEPIYITRIEDNNGNEIYRSPRKRVQAISEQGSYVMNEMLQRVQQGASGFRGIKSRYGGKTGTTNYQADGWFMGITPKFVVGTWVGCDDRFIRFRSLTYGQGARMARPIFQNFLRNVEKDEAYGLDTKARFRKPEEIEIETNCLEYEKFEGAGDEFNVGNPDYTQMPTDEGFDT